MVQKEIDMFDFDKPVFLPVFEFNILYSFNYCNICASCETSFPSLVFLLQSLLLPFFLHMIFIDLKSQV